MTPSPQTVQSGSPAAEAAKLMKEADAGMIPVVEKGRLLGTLTDRDIVLRGHGVPERVHSPGREGLRGARPTVAEAGRRTPPTGPLVSSSPHALPKTRPGYHADHALLAQWWQSPCKQHKNQTSDRGKGVVSVKHVTLAVLALAVAGCGSSKQSPPPAAPKPTTTLPLATTLTLERCVALWNAKPNREVRKLLLVVGAPLRDVSVGYPANHPENCLITASNPDNGEAAQFFGSTEPTTFRGSTIRGNYRLVGNDIMSSSDLEASATEWNASADERGTVTLNGG